MIHITNLPVPLCYNINIFVLPVKLLHKGGHRNEVKQVYCLQDTIRATDWAENHMQQCKEN